MKALTTVGLTKLIQLIKSSFIKTTDTVTTNTVTLATVATSGSYNDLSNKPTIPTVDQTFDGTSANAQSGVAIEGELANYQNKLVSGTNIKTINNTSILGSGDIDTKEIFIATYGTTTYAEIMAAYNDGKTVLLSTDNSIGIPQGSAFIFNSCYEKSVLKTICDSSTGWDGASYYLADTDLSNLSATGKAVIDGQWVNIDQSIISSATSLNGSTGLTYRVDLPNDGHKYEVMIRGAGYANSTAGNDLWILVTGNQDSMARYMGRARAGTAGTFACIGTVICTMSYVASSEKNLTLSRSTSWNGSCSELKVIAYRRIGTNS